MNERKPWDEEGEEWKRAPDGPPPRPCREEVSNVIQFIRDSLTSQELLHVTVQDDENPDCWSVAARDEEGYVTQGLISWSPEKGAVVYAVFDPLRASHDVAEGIPEDESKCWWMPNSAVMFVQALNGVVREVIAEDRAKKLAELDRETREGDEGMEEAA